MLTRRRIPIMQYVFWLTLEDSEVAASIAVLKACLLEHLLPSCCILCGQHCPNRMLCSGCENDLPRITACCRQCGLPGQRGAAELCADCLRHPPPWNHAVAALVYEYPVDHLVRRFKFHNDFACGQLLANELVRTVKLRPELCNVNQRNLEQFSLDQCPPDQGTMEKSRLEKSRQKLNCEKPDLLIPVPLHFLRRCKRGFNQAEFIAKELQRHCSIPLQRDLLRRTNHTSAQSGLDRKTRQKNLRDAFRCEPLNGLHVALVDDVLTTGATLQECSRTLKKAGARQISVWVAARVPAPAH